jgi:hypothetical protein
MRHRISGLCRFSPLPLFFHHLDVFPLFPNPDEIAAALTSLHRARLAAALASPPSSTKPR